MGLLSLRNALMTGKRLPYDAEVEYLESSGTQRIDSGIYLALSDIVECTFVPKNRNSVFGIYNSPGNSFNLTGTGSVSRLRYETQYKDAATTLDEVHTVKCGNGEYWVDGVLKATISFTDDTLAATCPIFARKTNLTTLNDYLIGQIMSFKIIRNSVAIFDAIPVRKGTVGYLYDRVSGKLFGNAGTGDFVLGPDVVPVEYIESHGTEYIDTGVIPTDATGFLVDIYPAGAIGNNVAVGCRQDSGDTRCWLNFYSFQSISVRHQIEVGWGTYTPLQDAFPVDSWNSYGLNWMNSRKMTIDDIVKLNLSQLTSISKSVYLFAANLFGTAGNYFTGRIRLGKVSDSVSIIRNFHPVRVGTEGAMMDVLTRRIYRNQGTGAFGYGNDLKYPIPAE